MRNLRDMETGIAPWRQRAKGNQKFSSFQATEPYYGLTPGWPQARRLPSAPLRALALPFAMS